MDRTIMNDSSISDVLWVQALHTIVHILKKAFLRSNCDQTPYGLWKRRPANVKHFRAFGSKCYVKRDDKKIGKFDSRVNEGIFVVYS